MNKRKKSPSTTKGPPSKFQRVQTVELNSDVISNIASFCDSGDVVNMSYVDKMFKQAVDADFIWEPLFNAKFACAPNEAELEKIRQIPYPSKSVYKKYYAFKNSYFNCKVIKYESLYEEFRAMLDGEEGELVVGSSFKPSIEWDQIRISTHMSPNEFWNEMVSDNLHKDTFINEFTGERFVMLRYESGGNEFGSVHPEGQVLEVAPIYDGNVLPYECESSKHDFLAAMDKVYRNVGLYYDGLH